MRIKAEVFAFPSVGRIIFHQFLQNGKFHLEVSIKIATEANRIGSPAFSFSSLHSIAISLNITFPQCSPSRSLRFSWKTAAGN
jgi:hypothetical protein